LQTTRVGEGHAGIPRTFLEIDLEPILTESAVVSRIGSESLSESLEMTLGRTGSNTFSDRF